MGYLIRCLLALTILAIFAIVLILSIPATLMGLVKYPRSRKAGPIWSGNYSYTESED